MEKSIRFRSYDGTALEGTLVAIQPGKSTGTVLLVHGITSDRDEFGLFSGLARHLKSRSLSTFRFDYRSHGAGRRSLEEMTLTGIANDIEAAARTAMRATSAAGVHVIGMSFGGGLSAFWGSATDLTVSSVVMLAPVLDYEEDVLGQHGLLRDGRLTDDAASALAREGYLEIDGIRYGRPLINELRHISGAQGLSRLKCPVLIIHGDADSVVPYVSSERFSARNAQCKLVNIPGTDHGFAVGDDEDLSSPETRAKHEEVFFIIAEFLARN